MRLRLWVCSVNLHPEINHKSPYPCRAFKQKRGTSGASSCNTPLAICFQENSSLFGVIASNIRCYTFLTTETNILNSGNKLCHEWRLGFYRLEYSAYVSVLTWTWVCSSVLPACNVMCTGKHEIFSWEGFKFCIPLWIFRALQVSDDGVRSE